MIGSRSALLRVCVPVLCALALLLVPAAAQAAKGSTQVGLRVLTNGTLYKYKVKVKSDRRSCRKNRDVTVWHDEDRSGVYESGEYVLGSGNTNNKGKFKFVTDVIPPVGDYVGVLVEGTSKCKEFQESHPLQS